VLKIATFAKPQTVERHCAQSRSTAFNSKCERLSGSRSPP